MLACAWSINPIYMYQISATDPKEIKPIFSPLRWTNRNPIHLLLLVPKMDSLRPYKSL